MDTTILKICQILSRHSVEYVIAGGTAVALHGYYRMTTLASGEVSNKYDFDFWYNPTYQNYFNLLDALEDLGIDVTLYRREKTPDPKKSFFRHEFDDFTIDFLPEILGLGKFNTSFQQRAIAVVDALEIPFLSLQDLIISKQATGRKKDMDDIAALQAIQPE